MCEMEDKTENKLKRGKTRRWCSVPQCKYNKEDVVHKFPSKNVAMRQKWAVVCRIGHEVTSNMHVCSAHFRKEDYIPTLHKKCPKLKSIAYPTLNLPLRKLDKVLTALQIKKNNERSERLTDRQKLRNERVSFLKESVTSETAVAEPEVSEIENSLEMDAEPIRECTSMDCDMMNDRDDPNDGADISAAEALLELNERFRDTDNKMSVVLEKGKIVCQAVQTSNEKITIMNLLKSDDDLKAFTGITFKLLKNFAAGLQTCKHLPNRHGISVESRIVLCLCKLKLNLSFKCLAVLCGITRYSCISLFATTVHSLAYMLKYMVYWPTKDEIQKSMPKCFKNFEKTYVVLSCTEIPIEQPKCLTCRLRLYSYYKGGETIKLLVGIAPCGLITYCSKLYGGRASDKAIFLQSNLISRLTPNRDAIMADKGFSIEAECISNGITLIIPPKLGKNKQMDPHDIMKTLKIASARVHVECTIQCLKLFEVLKNVVSLKMARYMDEICTIICAIINLRESIHVEKRF